MSIAAFYAAHVEDGRAVVRPGSVYESMAWIVRATHQHRATYWLCSASADNIRLLDPTADVARLLRRRIPLARIA